MIICATAISSSISEYYCYLTITKHFNFLLNKSRILFDIKVLAIGIDYYLANNLVVTGNFYFTFCFSGV